MRNLHVGQLAKFCCSVGLFATSFLCIQTVNAQHDGQRDSVILIGKGKHQAIAKTLAKKKPNAGPAESLFVEMLSLLDQDKVQPALEKARASVKAGLPFERLVVGPRPLLSKLHALPAFQTWQREMNPSPLVHGPMVGSVTSKSAAIWVRTRDAATVSVKIAGDKNAAVTKANTSVDSDFTGVVRVDGLSANSTYEYSVVVNGQSLQSGTFTTYPVEGSSSQFKVAFGGGAGFVPEWEYMWDTIRGVEPSAFLTLGDNVYIDDPTHAVTNYYCYYRRQSRPEWQRLTSSIPVYSIYDDHDFGVNDCVPGPEIETPAWKRDVWNIFRQNWVNPSYGGGERQPGCWYDFTIGDVHFICLDGRYYRDLKGKSMLGPVQKKWLFETLKHSQATFKVIASPVPFTAGIKKGSNDPWDGFPEEREEIFSYLEQEKIEGLFFIAADRHRTDLRITSRPSGYDLFEFESSRLTNHHTHPVVKTDGLIWGYNKTCSFGLMKFDTKSKDPTVTFEAIDIDGKVQHSYTLKRSQLKF